jgi:hypothetical protein
MRGPGDRHSEDVRVFLAANAKAGEGPRLHHHHQRLGSGLSLTKKVRYLLKTKDTTSPPAHQLPHSTTAAASTASFNAAPKFE